MRKWEQTVAILQQFFARGKEVAKPFPSGGLFLDVRVGRGDREDGLTSREVPFASGIPVLKFDAENLCNTVTELGGATTSHLECQCLDRSGRTELGRASLTDGLDDLPKHNTEAICMAD